MDFNITINAGLLTITPSGGVPPYKYRLNGDLEQSLNTFAKLPLGKYNIEVIDSTGLSKKKDIMLYDLVEPKSNDSFTMSYSFDKRRWQFFHDYIPSFFVNTFTRVWSLKFESAIYEHNTGGRGEFYDKIYPSYIDRAFNKLKQRQLMSFKWYADTIDDNKQPVYDKTFDYITVRNTYQSSGRVPILTENAKELFDDLTTTTSNTENSWSVNSFRNKGKKGRNLHKDIINNYDVIPENIIVKNHPTEEGYFIPPYVIVRLETENKDNYTIQLYEVNPLSHENNR